MTEKQQIYDKGYRKVPDGEWIKDNTSNFEHRYNCSVCDYRFFGIPTPYCPHGRPVLIEMTKRELEKNFGRV